MQVSAETLTGKFVCVGVSLLSIASGQHKSDMTFPQDVKMQEMGVTAAGL